MRSVTGVVGSLCSLIPLALPLAGLSLEERVGLENRKEEYSADARAILSPWPSIYVTSIASKMGLETFGQAAGLIWNDPPHLRSEVSSAFHLLANLMMPSRYLRWEVGPSARLSNRSKMLPTATPGERGNNVLSERESLQYRGRELTSYFSVI